MASAAASEAGDTASRAEYQRLVDAGDVIFAEGDPGDHLYVIRRGEVELSRMSSDGEQPLARLGPGDFFGELGVVLGEPLPMRATAVKRTILLKLDRETLESMCMAQPEIGIRMIRVLASRLIQSERKLWALAADAQVRPVVRALLRHALPAEGGKGIMIPLSLRNLAEEAGLSMIAAYRGLHRLLDRKLVKLTDDCLHAPDVEALSAAVDRPD